MIKPDQNVFFLISQPRSGSTMTQRILGSHSLIHTQSEPWVLLHPLHALRDHNIVAGYNSSLYAKALNDFIDKIPGGKAKYEDRIAQTYLDFYYLILKNNNKQYFLDKTPRYYYIIDELLEYFPGSKIIILWRNPAAVLSSIARSWIKDDWYRLSEFKDDLMMAPKLMIEAQKKHNKQVCVLKYEDLLADPIRQTSNLCKFLEIKFEEEMLQYGELLHEKWRYGDQGTVYEKKQPDASFAEKWQNEINHPQIWRALNDYLSFLGKESLLEMGYVYDDLMEVLRKNKPDVNIKKESIALEVLLDNTSNTFFAKNRLQTLHEQNSLLKHKDAVITEQRALIEKREVELKAIQDREAALKDTISANRKTITERQELIDRRDIELLSIKKNETILNKTIEEKEAIILEQGDEIKRREISLQQFRQQLKMSTEIKSSYESDLIKKSKKIDQLEAELHESLKSAHHLEEKINRQSKLIKEKDEHFELIAKSYSYRLGSFLLKPAIIIKRLRK